MSTKKTAQEATLQAEPKSPQVGVPAPVVAAPTATRYTLGDKVPRNGDTKQGAKSGLGKNWHSVAKPAANTRFLAFEALETILDDEETFTEAEALAALRPVVAGTSGTPRSYWKSFVASGYIVEA